MYSKDEDGAYCRSCVFFGKNDQSKKGKYLERLVHAPLKNWNGALCKFVEHDTKSVYHKNAVIDEKMFLLHMEHKSVAVDVQLDNAKKRHIEKNRQILKSIIKCVIFCGKQNIALRGHRDDSRDYKSDQNCGNFQRLLEFRCEAGDEILQQHFNECSKVATYRSKTVQNDVIDCIGHQIQQNIVEKVKASRFFSILADEAQDASNKEQMALIIRYVDVDGVINEDFLEFVHCADGTTGDHISKHIKTSLSKLGIDMADCRGQCYDGAGSMAGKNKGAAALIYKEYPKALYIHCASHRFNLCLMASCSVQNIRNMLDNLGELSRMFSFSSKKQELLTETIKETCPSEKKTKLLDVCKTRWVQRLQVMETFSDLYEPVVLTLEKIKDNFGGHWNADSVKQANCHYHMLTNFNFVIAFVIAREVFAVTRGMTVKMQHVEQDYSSAMSYVTTTRDTVQSYRDNVDAQHSVWYQQAKTIAESLDIEIKKPRTCGRQTHRSNVPADSVEDYYRKSVTIPFLDHLLEEINARFFQGHSDILSGFNILPGNTDIDWKGKFMQFCKMYSDDIPSIQNLQTEMDLWENYWSRNVYLKPKSLRELLPIVDDSMFPNIIVAVRLLCTIPVTSCECERSVSALRRLKTYMRTTMSQNRFNGLALMTVHYTHKIDIDAVVDEFARRNSRRMTFVDIFDDK